MCDSGLAEPLSFTKIAFDNHIYELSWKPPATNRAISSYTIFWCDNNKDRPYQCTGTLNWTRVSSDVTIKNITVPDDKIYQFAISANTKTESSGMVWASCTYICMLAIASCTCTMILAQFGRPSPILILTFTSVIKLNVVKCTVLHFIPHKGIDG
ncbi:hypothetical protein J6590_043301 [Homalodisca vitripennis]|nr:hypothetical protein J6590_043301 [Homalodisca vitripennis]